MGHLTKAEVDTLWDYQRRTGARSVKFGAGPSTWGYNPLTNACSSQGTFRFSPGAQMGASGLKPTAALSAAGLYRCPGAQSAPQTTCPLFGNTRPRGLFPACTPTPVFEDAAGVVGAAVKYADGRESLAFTTECAAWASPCFALAHYVLPWMLRDIIPGERRALLSVQVRGPRAPRPPSLLPAPRRRAARLQHHWPALSHASHAANKNTLAPIADGRLFPVQLPGRQRP